MSFQCISPRTLPLAALKDLVSRSHELVLQRLPKKLQKELLS